MRRWLIACALAWECATAHAQTPGQTPAAKPVPVETFSELPLVESALLSPDGRRLAAKGRSEETITLVLLDLDTAGAQPKVLALGKGAIADMSWAGPDRLLLTVVMPGSLGVLGLPTLRLVGYDLRTGTASVLDAKSRGLVGGNVLAVDPAGRWALVASQDTLFDYPSVKRVDLATGSAALVEKARPDVWDWYADEAGTVRAGIAYAERRWKIWYRASPAEPLRPLRSKVGELTDDVVDSLQFLSDTRSGVIVTNSRTGRFAAYRYDFTTGAIGDAIYENPAVDIAKVIADPLTGHVAGVTYEDDRRRTVWFDPDRRALQARIEKALPGNQNVIVNASADGNRVLVWSYGAAATGTYYLLDRKAHRFEAVLQPYAGLNEVTLAPVKPVSYAARDGLTIPAYLTLPPGKPAKALPLIVLPHGGPFLRDSWEYDGWVQFLASRGYAVLQPQFRGSTGYGKAFVERGYGQWGRAMQDDLDDGMDWLVESGQVDPKRVCIMGGSYGGYAAMWGAIRNPERYRCAISIAGVSDLKVQLRANRKSFSATRYYRAWQSKVRGDDTVDLDSVSPLARAGDLRVPLLIAHGEADATVLPAQSHAMVAALTKRGAKVESVFYKDEGHGFSKRDDSTDFLKRVEAFLRANNPG